MKSFLQPSLSRTLLVAGAMTVAGTLAALPATADVGPDPNFNIFSITPQYPAIGSTFEVTGRGCEPGSAAGDESTVLLEVYITDGTENFWLSTGTITELNPDGTWTGEITVINEIPDGPASVVGPQAGLRLHAQCNRVNDPEGPESIDSYVPDLYFVDGAAPTTTVGATTVAPTAPPVVDNDELPRTGTSTLPLAVVGGGLVALGGVASLARRRTVA